MPPFITLYELSHQQRFDDDVDVVVDGNWNIWELAFHGCEFILARSPESGYPVLGTPYRALDIGPTDIISEPLRIFYEVDHDQQRCLLHRVIKR